MAINTTGIKNAAVGILFAGMTCAAGYWLYSTGDKKVEERAAAALAARNGVNATNPVLKEQLAARKKFGLFGEAEKNAKDANELSKKVAEYVASGKQGKVLGLINRNAYVFDTPEDYLVVATTLSKSLGEAGSMWFFEDAGMGQKKNHVGVVPGVQSKELTVEAATVYALALSMDRRMDERFLRLGFATFTKHLNGRPKAVNGMIALYWGFREAVEIACRPVPPTDSGLLAPKEAAKVSLLKFLSATMDNAEVNEEYRAMAAKLLTFSGDMAMKAKAEAYLQIVKGSGKRLLELIEKFEAERRANLLDA
ncbi:MAG: hypothetical protein QXH30_01265 [Candidatus Bilamarchaeaceae archaeon]